ncbi:unnamed protein product [Echinostoma caproni]|uniref:Ras-related protein Rab-35 n=1 Tax=Echinostoma caproni TaxID=27848 RepID=A0A183A8R5_9TREM|nr:unnamed protein product [Echinostoma caproni]
MFKVILVGDSNVGKSSFMHQFCDGVFYPKLRTTVGVDFRTRNLRVDNTVYTIQLWDTAGQEKYRSIVRTYFRKVDGVIIIYDVTCPESFRNVRSWMESVEENSGSNKTPIIIVGNKIDLRDGENAQNIASCVTTEMGQRFAQSQEALFIETSVCKAENVDKAVQLLSREMKLGEDEQIGTVALKEEPPKKKPLAACCK